LRRSSSARREARFSASRASRLNFSDGFMSCDLLTPFPDRRQATHFPPPCPPRPFHVRRPWIAGNRGSGENGGPCAKIDRISTNIRARSERLILASPSAMPGQVDQ
jgi:hypothetical protein